MSAVLLVARHARAMFRREPWWAEFWSAAVAIAWSLLSVVGADPLRDWPSMRLLSELGGDRFWHVAALGLGSAQLVFLVLDERWLRGGTAIAMGGFWGVLTVGVWAALPWAPGVAVYAGWCGINLFSITRLLRHYP